VAVIRARDDPSKGTERVIVKSLPGANLHSYVMDRLKRSTSRSLHVGTTAHFLSRLLLDKNLPEIRHRGDAPPARSPNGSVTSLMSMSPVTSSTKCPSPLWEWLLQNSARSHFFLGVAAPDLWDPCLHVVLWEARHRDCHAVRIAISRTSVICSDRLGASVVRDFSDFHSHFTFSSPSYRVYQHDSAILIIPR
jgi:hypothetical protein